MLLEALKHKAYGSSHCPNRAPVGEQTQMDKMVSQRFMLLAQKTIETGQTSHSSVV